jgi:predicted small secreted protein
MFTFKIAVLLLSGFIVAGCGNTISGVGKDISDVGAKVTKWQNEEGKKDEK